MFLCGRIQLRLNRSALVIVLVAALRRVARRRLRRNRAPAPIARCSSRCRTLRRSSSLPPLPSRQRDSPSSSRCRSPPRTSGIGSSRGYAVPDLDGPLVEKWEQWYAERPDYVARMIDRSRRYLYHIVNEIDGRGMPLEIALLPMVESAFNPTAMSSGARLRHLAVHALDRQALRTQAELLVRLAARRDRGHRQGARLPAEAVRRFRRLAARARGVQLGRGQRASRRSRATRRRGCPTDYASLDRMPAETRNYLPKLQAVKNIVTRAGEVRPVARGHSRRAVLHRREDDAQDGRQARGRARRAAAGRVPRAQSRSTTAR